MISLWNTGLMRGFPRIGLVLIIFLSTFGGGQTSFATDLTGEELYERCQACHSLTRNRTGPKHCGLLGRTVGTVTGYRYSDAMKNAGFKWTRKTLDQFLFSPTEFLPGTTMGYDGIKNKAERQVLVTWLLSHEKCSS